MYQIANGVCITLLYWLCTHIHMCAYTSTPNTYISYVVYKIILGLFCMTIGKCVVFRTIQITCSQYNYIFLVLCEQCYGYQARPLVIFSNLQINVSHIIVRLPSCPYSHCVYGNLNLSSTTSPYFRMSMQQKSSPHCYTIWITWQTKGQYNYSCSSHDVSYCNSREFVIQYCPLCDSIWSIANKLNPSG